MIEREMEELLAAYPDEFFPRHPLVLRGRQQSFAGVGIPTRTARVIVSSAFRTILPMIFSFSSSSFVLIDMTGTSWKGIVIRELQSGKSKSGYFSLNAIRGYNPALRHFSEIAVYVH